MHTGGQGSTHGISLAKALKAAAKVRVLVSMAAPRPSMATAPRGRGCVMMPTMVPRKTASRRQACKAQAKASGGLLAGAASQCNKSKLPEAGASASGYTDKTWIRAKRLLRE